MAMESVLFSELVSGDNKHEINKGRTIIFLTGGGGTIFQRFGHNFFLNFSLSKQIFSEILVRQTIYFFNLLKSNNFFSSMGYSLIYGIKGNLSNSTLYRCREKLLIDGAYAALSKAVLCTIISTRGSLSPDKVSLPAGKQPNLLFFKGLRKNHKTSNETGQPSLLALSAHPKLND